MLYQYIHIFLTSKSFGGQGEYHTWHINGAKITTCVPWSTNTTHTRTQKPCGHKVWKHFLKGTVIIEYHTSIFTKSLQFPNDLGLLLQALTSGVLSFSKEDTSNVRPWNWEVSGLISWSANEGAVMLWESPSNTVLSPIRSVIDRILPHTKTQWSKYSIFI